MPPGPTGTPHRQARSIRNDERILDAGLRLLTERGWSDLTFAPVADLAGLSMRPVRDRYADRSDLAAAIWAERIYPVLREDVVALQEATEVVIKAGIEEAGALIDALQAFLRPAPRMRAAMELMIVAGFNPVVRGALDATLLPPLRKWITPGLDAPTPAEGARRAFVLSTAFGMVVTGLQLGEDFPRSDGHTQALARALSANQEPSSQPTTTADHLDLGTDFGTGEDAWDALLQVTLDQVGTRGYDAATTMSIARASAHTEGFLFARYDSKLDLFFDATQRLVSRTTGANVAYQQQVADRYSSGMAEAVVMREFMRPGRERLRVVNLEQFRLSWHDERFQRMMNQSFEPFFEAIAVTVPQDRDAGRARAFTELVLGTGPVVLSQLLPETWELPYDVVTIPLLDQPS